MSKVALITGVNGQDGYYLSSYLESLGYEVHGTVRSKSDTVGEKNGNIHYLDLAIPWNLESILDSVKPDEVYNLAAQSHVGQSFKNPIYTLDVTGLGAIRVFEACRNYRDRTGKQIKIYQASSSEMFGSHTGVVKFNEFSKLSPQSPYAAAKVLAHQTANIYRKSYDMFICCGILFNHESVKRGEGFVTRKITLAASRIKCGLQDKLLLGDIYSLRDWGFAGDYVEAMNLMLTADVPQNYVVATGKTNSVKDIIDLAFGYVGLDPEKYVESNSPMFNRPDDVTALIGDASKIKELGWNITYKFEDIIENMMRYDLALAKKEKDYGSITT